MAVHAVSYPARSALSRRWLRFGARVALAALAMWGLHLAEKRYVSFQMDYASTFHMDFWLWLAWVGTLAGAGFVFGLALVFPFSRIRYAWSRLLLAALLLVPVAQWWLLWGYLLPRRHQMGGWFVTTADWFGHVGTQAALAVLAGVAIASGFRAKHSEPAQTSNDVTRSGPGAVLQPAA